VVAFKVWDRLPGCLGPTMQHQTMKTALERNGRTATVTASENKMGGRQIKDIARHSSLEPRPFSLFRLADLGQIARQFTCANRPPWTLCNAVTRELQHCQQPPHPLHIGLLLCIMSGGSSFPEYYVLLEVPQSATTEEIRAAYRRESLKCVSFAPPLFHSNSPFFFHLVRC
jgi:hypothetical protein